MMVIEYMNPSRVNYRFMKPATCKRSKISLSYFTAFNISQLLTIEGKTKHATKGLSAKHNDHTNYQLISQ